MPEPGTPPPDKSPLQTFLDRPVIHALQAAGADADIRFAETLSSKRINSFHFIVEQRFSVVPSSSGSGAPSGPIEIVLGLQRARLAAEGGSRWLVTTYEAPAASPTSPPAR